jgi:hypothetical protein
MTRKNLAKSGIVHRAAHTLRQYAIIFAYLYVCFGAIVLLKASVLRDVGISYAPWGFAAVKALILGKFMLIGHDIRLGERFTGRPLIYPTIYRSFVFLVFLFVLLAIEEAVAGALHGHSVAESLSEVVGNKFFEILASTLVMFLALLPYFAIRQLADAVGAERLARLFFVDGKWQEGEPGTGAVR